MELRQQFRDRFPTHKEIALRLGVKPNTLAQWLLGKDVIGKEKMEILKELIQPKG